MEFFYKTKDRTPFINQSFVVYEFTCPSCGAYYVGKTERTLNERCVEHEWIDQNSIVKNHLDQCVGVQYLLNITSLGPALSSNDNNIGSADNRVHASIYLLIIPIWLIAIKILTFFYLKRK